MTVDRVGNIDLDSILAYSFKPGSGKDRACIHLDWGNYDLVLVGRDALVAHEEIQHKLAGEQ